MKRVFKTMELITAVGKLHDPQCKLLLLSNCAGVGRLFYAIRTCPPDSFGGTQVQFNLALRASLEKIVTASGPGFGDWQWRLATLPIKMGGLGIFAAGDVINYAFLASRLQTSSLQARILANSDLHSLGWAFERALGVFRVVCGSNAFSLNDESAAPHMMKKLAEAYFNVVENNLVSSYMLTPRQIAILSSTREPHAQDFLLTIPIDGLG
jgi:hypothetical protein